MKMKWVCGCRDDGYVYPTEFYPCATHRRAFYRNRIDAALKEVAAAEREAIDAATWNKHWDHFADLRRSLGYAAEYLARALRALEEV